MDVTGRFTQAFEDYSDALFRHCFFRIGDRERSLELVQESFTKTWNYVARGKTIDDFKPFLYRVLNNLIIDEYRKKKTTSLDEFLEREDASEGDIPDLHSTGEMEQAEMRFDGTRLLKALKTLPEKYREVVTMRYMDGFSPREIAELIGENENVVSVRIHRGLSKLRNAIQL